MGGGRTANMVGSLVPMVDPLVTDYAWQGPKRGADRAVLLAHGAGTGMTAASLTVVADALADAGIPSLRFNYPYRSAGKNAPDRPKVLDAATRRGGGAGAPRQAPAGTARARRPLDGWPLLLDGGRCRRRSRPGAGAPAARLSAARGREAGAAARRALPASAGAGALRERHARLARGQRRAHQGSGDPRSKPSKGRVAFHWLDTADHGYRPLKSSGRTVADINAEVAAAAVEWVSGPGLKPACLKHCAVCAAERSQW